MCLSFLQVPKVTKLEFDIFAIFLYLYQQRYRIFLFSGKSSSFATFGENRVSEWKYCFFFQCCIFFSGWLIWVSEWILNFSWEKKIKCPKSKNSGQKKNYSFRKKKIQLCPKSSEWVGPKLFRETKNTVPLDTSVILTKKFFIFVGTFYRGKNCNFLKEKKVVALVLKNTHSKSFQFKLC